MGLWWAGYPLALALTCAVEVPAYLLAWSALGWCGPARPWRRRQAVVLAFAVNLLSHPLLWVAVLRWSGLAAVVTAEVAVVLGEGLLVFGVRRRAGRLLARPPGGPADPSARALLGWSLLVAAGVNALSWLTGLVVLPVLTAAVVAAAG